MTCRRNSRTAIIYNTLGTMIAIGMFIDACPSLIPH